VYLNRERNTFKRFDVTDGLLSNHFNEQSACATQKDFLFIQPIKDSYYFSRMIIKKVTPLYRPTSLHSKSVIKSSPMSMTQELKLRPNQIFQYRNIGLNYMSPSDCRYAYRGAF
jgi:hypothetical protein